MAARKTAACSCSRKRKVETPTALFSGKPIGFPRSIHAPGLSTNQAVVAIFISEKNLIQVGRLSLAFVLIVFSLAVWL